jgi:hypothetical protein
MTATPNQEQQYVTVRKEARDNTDGYDRGYYTPYPKDKEELILANIEKVSPTFVRGYRQGKYQAAAEESLGTYDPDDYPDYNDPFE